MKFFFNKEENVCRDEFQRETLVFRDNLKFHKAKTFKEMEIRQQNGNDLQNLQQQLELHRINKRNYTTKTKFT